MSDSTELSADERPSNPLPIQALDLFDRCLAQGNAAPIVAFVQQQVILQPPNLDLFRDFADDLQQRIVTLRTSLYDLRDRLVTRCAQQYRTDITVLLPAESLAELHTVEPASILRYVQSQRPNLSSDDQHALSQYTEESIQTAMQISGDMELTEMLYDLVLDWFDALCAAASRREWWNALPPLGELPQ